VRLELRNGLRRPADDVAVRRQDEFDTVLFAGLRQAVQRIEVGAHVAVGRVDDGGAAAENITDCP